MSSHDPHVSSELSRELNLFHVTMMGLGMMIGAGIFIGIGNCINIAGPGGVILTFTLNGVLALFTAMSYAELSSAIPKAGGAYNFARVGFGRGTSFIAGWMEWLASSVAGSLYAITFAIYVNSYIINLLKILAETNPSHIIITILNKPGLIDFLFNHTDLATKILAFFTAIFFLYINYRGASETGKVGAIFTFGQILFLVIIGAMGIFLTIKDPSRLANFKPFMPEGWRKLLVTMGFIYIAFEGYEVIAQAGDETINPRKNLPKAILYSVIIVTFIYIIVTFTTVIAVKQGDPGINIPAWQWIGSFKEKGFGAAISRIIPYADLLLTLAVIFAATSALNATIYSATRACYALGRDKMLPEVTAKISKKRKTPYVALILTGAIIIAVATLLPTESVASSASIMFLFLFFLVNVCVIKIRRNMGDELHYGYLMPLFPLFPILAIILQPIIAVELVHVSVIAWIIAPSWVILGILIYIFYSKKRALPTADEIHIFEEEKATHGDSDYHIMVGVSNPKNVLTLVSNTNKLCQSKNARVELLHMVPVPMQVPLTDAENYMLEGQEAMVEAMLYLAPLFPVSTTFRYCRSIARGIVSAIREKSIDLLILGWHGKAKPHWYNIGSTIDPIIERSPCDVVVMKDCANKKFKNVLVPIAGGPNSALALEMASILVEKTGGKIVVFSVKNNKYQFDSTKFINKHQDRIKVPLDMISTKTVTSNHVMEKILEETENYDLIVLGFSNKPMLIPMRANIPEQIATRCTKPLVMVKTNNRLRSIVKKVI